MAKSPRVKNFLKDILDRNNFPIKPLPLVWAVSRVFFFSIKRKQKQTNQKKIGIQPTRFSLRTQTPQQAFKKYDPKESGFIDAQDFLSLVLDMKMEISEEMAFNIVSKLVSFPEDESHSSSEGKSECAEAPPPPVPSEENHEPASATLTLPQPSPAPAETACETKPSSSGKISWKDFKSWHGSDQIKSLFVFFFF
jgi:hypothetical protein